MRIRQADLTKDALQLLEAGRDLASRVSFSELLPNGDLKLQFSQIMAIPGLETLVAEHENRIVGAIGILYAPYLWNANHQCAEQLFIWAHQEAPFRTAWHLMNAALTSANDRDAIPMFHYGGRWLRKNGFRLIEDSLYMRF